MEFTAIITKYVKSAGLTSLLFRQIQEQNVFLLFHHQKSDVSYCSRALIFDDGKEEKRFVLEFAGTAEMSTQRFSFEIRKGMYTVRFVFLPGSRFDFESRYMES